MKTMKLALGGLVLAGTAVASTGASANCTALVKAGVIHWASYTGSRVHGQGTLTVTKTTDHQYFEADQYNKATGQTQHVLGAVTADGIVIMNPSQEEAWIGYQCRGGVLKGHVKGYTFEFSK